jgi:hypothetical protein
VAAVLRDPQTGRWRWKPTLLTAGLIAVVLGPLSAYVGYRVLLRKNPEVIREIEQSAQRQQELDDLFAEPVTDAVPNR